MFKPSLCLLLLTVSLQSFAQNKAGTLTVAKIMRDPKWIGTSPSDLQWSNDGNTLYFSWNPEKAAADSLYYISTSNKIPVKAKPQDIQSLNNTSNYVYTLSKLAYVYSKDGDIFYVDTKTGKTKRITQTTDAENNPQFSFNETRIVYNRNQNLYAWDIASGETIQLTNLKSGDVATSAAGGFGNRGGNTSARANRDGGPQGNAQEEWLKNDQLQYFEVLRTRKEDRESGEAYNRSLPKTKEIRSINIEDKILQGLSISPDGRFISYRLFKGVANPKTTIVPSYITESGFTTDINGRTKVGALQAMSEFYIYDRNRDTVIAIKTDSIPGIKDLPDYVKDYPKDLERRTKNPLNRAVTFNALVWSPKGNTALVDIRARDNKDRWLMLWDTANGGRLQLLDRQRDEAWIGGPGIGFSRNFGWTDDNTVWFQSEATGYSHLYTINVNTKQRRALTAGKYEVEQAQLSRDKKYFYIVTNEVHPGEQQFYRLTIADSKKERITTMTGAYQVTVSPDEKYIGLLYSYSTKPWELFLQENKPGAKAEQITNKAQSEEFKSYAWRDPEVLSFTASDGAVVYARVYKPTTPHANKPAVLFVHGAGYLQNAHKWWSSYYREFMFNNLLADEGYYVMDIDYRGSAGYGRDWRTAIYRHMGGKDLDDNVDAVNYLVKTYGVNPQHVGLYGGSYGGFLSLMGMFNKPDVFAAGAALRPVTNWANYNHGYTANILNEPYNDSLAYRRSSPLYFAEGLKGHLLICHGMMDVNVHFQDAVELSQRLIELGKDNWQLAPFPMEDHDFAEPSSWTDEYKRIFKLFEDVLKK
ncbi:prolyl oligopeptidase family serine peptidase [Ferruginibacter sp. SUN106]|uniref:S9 family peptidase n=1 Tax=Ferruginibacter sp. SUN106 TaxID=2978348 RepID=UPI003D363869